MLDRTGVLWDSLSMNKLPTKQRAQILGMMVEGMAIRAISRMTGASKNTIVKLLADAGAACLAYQDAHLRNLPCKRLQLDEIWSFNYCKQATVANARNAPEGAGDVWTWTAIDADTKLVPSWYIGRRDSEAAIEFICDLKQRLAKRVQITSDGHKAYLKGMEAAFGGQVDYAILTKIYGPGIEGARRYSPPQIVGIETQCCSGIPDMEHVSTSFVERQNLTMRMGMRRFTRLTNAFSKKIENHEYAIAIYFMHYNFVRIHQTLKISPAMAAGVTGKLWSLEDIVAIADEYEVAQKQAA